MLFYVANQINLIDLVPEISTEDDPNIEKTNDDGRGANTDEGVESQIKTYIAEKENEEEIKALMMIKQLNMD